MKTIQHNAEEIDSLSRKIDETIRYRFRSEKCHSEWEQACKAFHLFYKSHVYPGGESRWILFRTGDPAEFETAIAFLSPDPGTFDRAT
ncbi:MAG: hypothetical protein IPN40_15195 [Uliginosibacterium sp.]|nr:hypothetical protein [Uliginosibacterium sp.]